MAETNSQKQDHGDQTKAPVKAKKETKKVDDQVEVKAYPTEFTREVLRDLESPFPEVKWRPQSIRKSPKNGKTYGIMIAYISARNVIDRLNDIVGPGNWSFTWEEVPTSVEQYKKDKVEYNGKVYEPEKDITEKKYVVHGSLEILGIVKEDVGYPNSDKDTNPLKSAVSDALKRCAVQFGVGRFLYSLKNEFIEYDPQTKQPVRPNDLKKLENMFKPIG